MRPQTAMFGEFPDPLPQFGPAERLKLCLYKRAEEEGTRDVALRAEDPVLGTGACVCPGV